MLTTTTPSNLYVCYAIGLRSAVHSIQSHLSIHRTAVSPRSLTQVVDPKPLARVLQYLKHACLPVLSHLVSSHHQPHSPTPTNTQPASSIVPLHATQLRLTKMASLFTSLFALALFFAAATAANIPLASTADAAEDPTALIRTEESNTMPSLIENVVRQKQCCYRDACTGVRTCVNAGTFWTDGCGRTYNVAPDCKLTRKKCCYIDACNGRRICFEAITVFTDSCPATYLVQASCKLRRL